MIHFFKLVAIFGVMISANSMAQKGKLPPDIFQTEEIFLSQAGPEWSRVAEGVYERQKSDGGVTRIGFGQASFHFYLTKAYENRETLLTRVTAGEGGDTLQTELKGNTALIAYLEKALERGEEEQSGDPSGSVCSGHYTLNPTIGFGFAGGWAQSTANWSEFGPFAPYKKYFYVSARATDTSTSPERVAYDWDSQVISHTCCFAIGTDKVEAYPTFSCELESLALLYVYNGCSAYRCVENIGSCP